MLSILKQFVKKDVRNNKKKGFTLIELIIVITIIGVLAVIAVPKFSGVLKDAKAKSDVASAKTIADATYALIAKDGITKATYLAPSELGAEIKAYIQVIPTVKAVTGSNFLVKIDADENVFVTVGGVQLYPVQVGQYPPTTTTVIVPQT